MPTAMPAPGTLSLTRCSGTFCSHSDVYISFYMQPLSFYSAFGDARNGTITTKYIDITSERCYTVI